MTRLLALLGNPVSHSLSPRIQNAAFRAAGLDGYYVALRAEAETVPGLLRGIALAGGGGNVTIPHKQLAFACVDRVTAHAERTQAVNTFWEHEGVIWGDNTDVEGLASALDLLAGEGTSLHGARALILGAGGASRAAVVCLEALGVQSVAIRSRRPSQAEALLRDIGPSMRGSVELWGTQDRSEADLVLNATPLGLLETDPFPLDVDQVPPSALVMDLVYRPQRTAWIRALADAGHRAMDGGEMLIGQGRAAFERWWGVRPPPGAFEAALEEIRSQHGQG
jgi:shikimate dehydrogenase